MLFLILIYLAVSFICLQTGWLFYKIITKKNADPDREYLYERPAIIYLITGLILLTCIAEWLVLLLPLNNFSILFILLVVLLLSVIYRKHLFDFYKNVFKRIRENNILFFLCLFSFTSMILVINAGPTIMDDTDSYHIQMIKWIKEFGTVPGIANLHLRFGFNSSWFISIGLLSPRVNNINSYLSLNGLLSLWFCYYILGKIFSFFRNDTISANALTAYIVILALCMIDWPMIRGNASNTNYDFITTCCILILFLESFFGSKTSASIEWFIWPCYLFTIRMINYPLLLLSLYWLIILYKSNNKKPIIFYILTGLLLILPFLIRNTILSGYAFFPVYQLDFFSFDWKADKQKLIEISEYIKYFNRVNPGYYPLTETRQLDFPAWILFWYKYLFRVDKMIVSLSFICYAVLLVRWKKFFRGAGSLQFFVFVMILQLVSWFLTAPDPRFVYAPLLIGIFLLIYYIPIRFIKTSSRLMMSISICLSIVVVGYSINKILYDKKYWNWISPRNLPIPSSRKIVIGEIELNIPHKILNNWNPRCYDIALPCLYHVDPRLKARGKNIEYGFKLADSASTLFVGGEYKIEP